MVLNKVQSGSIENVVSDYRPDVIAFAELNMTSSAPPPESHTKRDLERVGPVIFSGGIPLALIGVRFLLKGGYAETNAAIMFWIVAAMLFSVGIGVMLSARRMPQ